MSCNVLMPARAHGIMCPVGHLCHVLICLFLHTALHFFLLLSAHGTPSVISSLHTLHLSAWVCSVISQPVKSTVRMPAVIGNAGVTLPSLKALQTEHNCITASLTTKPHADTQGHVIYNNVFDEFNSTGQRARVDQEVAFDPTRTENIGYAVSTSYFYTVKFAAEKFGLVASWADIMVFAGGFCLSRSPCCLTMILYSNM